MATVLIPAKSTSTRIKQKNLTDVAGHPLIEWTLKACVNWTHVDRIVVATDHEEIRKIANSWGADIFPLEDVDLKDQRTVAALWKHFCAGEEDDSVQIIMHPTNPLRKLEELARLWDMWQTGDYDIIVSLREVRHLIMDHNGLSTEGPESRMSRLTQNVKPKYILDGSYYITTAKYVRDCAYFEEGRNGIFTVSKMSGLEIDDAEELELVRIVAKATNWWDEFLE